MLKELHFFISFDVMLEQSAKKKHHNVFKNAYIYIYIQIGMICEPCEKFDNYHITNEFSSR